MMQEWIVAVIVGYAAWIVAKRYAPKPVRRFFRAWTVRTATRLGWTRLAMKFDISASAAVSCADGCGTCGGCGSAEVEAAPTQFTITPDALKRTASQSWKSEARS
jgi:hypothetical protein